MQVPSPINTILEDPRKSIALLVIGAALCLFLFNLGLKPFWDYDEATYANVTRDTLETGQILTLHWNNVVWFEKPPLYFWLSMAAETVLHHPESSYRLTAAIAGVLSVILVMLITYEMRRHVLIACLAGMILLTTGTFVEAGREMRLDVPAIAAILFSVFAFLRGLRDPRWLIGVGVGLGIGFMFKSVIGLLSVPFLFWWSVLHWDFGWLKSRYALFSALAFLAIAAPWHLYETAIYGGEFWKSYFGHHVINRFEGNILNGSVSNIGLINYFLTFAAPWTTLFLFSGMWLLTQYRRFAEQAIRALLVCALTALSILAIFLMSSTKIYYYLLPSYPFVAITLALFAYELFPSLKRARYLAWAAGTALCALTGFALWVTINFGFHLFPIVSVNDLITTDERNAGRIIAESPSLDVYTYRYDYWETFPYYIGKPERIEMRDDDVLEHELFLIMPEPLADQLSFPPDLAAHFTTEYKGPTLILYRFTP
jgi:4-amino-4-deoxy-L-arabinose transferase-like glycosyltransferase